MTRVFICLLLFFILIELEGIGETLKRLIPQEKVEAP
jgi:predicted PurR-regulated permease PerM